MNSPRQLFTRVLGIAALMALGACRDTVAPTASSPRATTFSPMILDGAHGGNKSVFFLPPMVSNPSGQPGFGDPVRGDLSVSYKILRLDKPGTTECGTENSIIKEFTGVPFLTDHYQADWHTDESNLNANCTYRIEVFVSSTSNAPGEMKAFGDVDVVSSGSQLKRVDTDEYIALLDGRTLPIKVRIEEGVTFCTDPNCVSEVVPNNTTTLVKTLDKESAALFPPNWFDPAQVGSDQVIVTIEDITSQVTGDGKQGCSLGLTKMVSTDAHCVRFSTEPRVTSTTAEITVMVCQEDRGDRSQMLLKYDVDEAPKFLRNVPPPFDCPEPPPTGIGATNFGRVMHLASLALTHALQSVIGPRMAYAFDLGVGGSIGIGDGFSVITTGHPIHMVALSALDQTGTAGQILESAPTVQLKFVHRPSDTDPIGPNDASVTCKVIGTNGSLVDEGDVQEAPAFRDSDDEDGVYHCPGWRPGSGANVVEVSAANVDDVVIVGGVQGTLAGKVRFTATGTNATPSLVLFGTNSGDDGLSIINPGTGGVSFIGAFGQAFQSPISLAARSSDGALFAWDNVAEALVAIDKCTGQGTLVNIDATGLGVFNELAFAADGTLYGIQQLPSQLVKIDASTGRPIDEAPKPFNVNGAPVSAPGGATFGPDGKLYAIGSGQLMTINTATGELTLVGNLNPNPPGLPDQALAFSSTGVLYGSTNTQFFTIDPATGAVSNQIAINAPQGMAFAPGCPEVIR